MANLVLVCSFHHHLLHEGGWRLWRSVTDGMLHLRDPQGRYVPVVRHGRRVDPSCDATVAPSDDQHPVAPPLPRRDGRPDRRSTRPASADPDPPDESNEPDGWDEREGPSDPAHDGA